MGGDMKGKQRTCFDLKAFKRCGSPCSGALPGAFDLGLPVGHAQPHPRHAGMFLDAVRQRLRMRGNPELDVFRCANDQARQGIQKVRVQAGLRFVDG